MTSWNDLPFEIKSQILAAYIAITMLSYPSGSSDQEQLQSFRRFTVDILGFLHIATDMPYEAVAIMKIMIKERMCWQKRLEQDVNARSRSGRDMLRHVLSIQGEVSRNHDKIKLLKFCSRNLRLAGIWISPPW